MAHSNWKSWLRHWSIFICTFVIVIVDELSVDIFSFVSVNRKCRHKMSTAGAERKCRLGYSPTLLDWLFAVSGDNWCEVAVRSAAGARHRWSAGHRRSRPASARVQSTAGGCIANWRRNSRSSWPANPGKKSQRAPTGGIAGRPARHALTCMFARADTRIRGRTRTASV